MTQPFPTWTVVQSSLELVGIGVGGYLSSLEGAETGGYFLMGVHVIFLIHICLGLVFYYRENYTSRIGPHLRLIFAGMYFFSLAAMGLYFYFIVKISDPNVFDILLNQLGIVAFFVLLFYIAKLVCYTYFAYFIFSYIRGYTTQDPVPAPQTPSKKPEPKVPLYLLDYEKMFGKL